MPDHGGPPLDLLVEPLERVGAADLAAMGVGEGEMDEEVGLGLGEQVGHRREAASRPSTTRRSWALAEASSGCSKIEPDDGRDHPPRRARDEVLGVAGEVDPAALPGGSEELLVDRLDQAPVVVADDQPDARQAALDERRG